MSFGQDLQQRVTDKCESAIKEFEDFIKELKEKMPQYDDAGRQSAEKKIELMQKLIQANKDMLS